MRRPRARAAALAAAALAALLLYCYCCSSAPPAPGPATAAPATHASPARRLARITANNTDKKLERIVLSLVACGERLNESLNVVKSTLIFTVTPIYFIIFTDEELLPVFNEKLNKWRLLRRGSFNFELQRVRFPEKHKQQWMNLFGKCAAQRLFIPSLIPHIDSVIYVDSDTLFLGPADNLWRLFETFNSTQVAALALEDENPNVSWYPRFAKHPFYGKVGLNSGVMLMNLTRMRNLRWDVYVTPIMLKWKMAMPWGDQDIINVIFHYHPRAVLEMSCRYNYRSDQCMYGDACRDAALTGAHVLHGSRGVFHSQKQPAFQAVYRAIDEYKLGTDPIDRLLQNLNQYFKEAPLSNCGNISEAFLKVPSDTINNIYSKPHR